MSLGCSDLFYKRRLFKWISSASYIYIYFKKTKWEDIMYAWDLFPFGLCPHFPYFHILKLKRRKWKTLNAIKILLIENSAEIFETGEMKAVELIKFNGVFLLACIQSKWVHLVVWGKDFTLPDFKGKDLRENCLNTANFFEGLLFFLWIGIVGKRTDA